MTVSEHIRFLATISPDGEGDAVGLIRDQQSLPAFLRALLVADGTVTTLLCAFFSEEILVQTIDQGTVAVDLPLPALHLGAGDQAFQRQVLLKGGTTDKEYASAISLLNPAALDPGLFEALIAEDVGMGEVLRNSVRGSFREVLDVRALQNRMQRTYLVYLDSRPAIMITESFDTAHFC